MPNWHRFVPSDFEYDFERDSPQRAEGAALMAHQATAVSFPAPGSVLRAASLEALGTRRELYEAMECFFSDFEVRRNKRYLDRFQLLGVTSGGRRLKIIFQLKADNVVRIIAGWPI